MLLHYGLTRLDNRTLAIILLVFGTTRLPKLASSMGKAVKEFRKATDGEKRTSRNGRRPSPKEPVN